MKKFFLPIIFCLALLSLSISAQGQALPVIKPVPLFTNTTVTATGGANITTNSTTLHRPIDIPPNTIVVLQTVITPADVGTSNVVFGFNHSQDSSFWKNDLATTATVACVASNVTTVTHTILGTNILTRFISLESITSRQTNVVTVSEANIIFFPYVP